MNKRIVGIGVRVAVSFFLIIILLYIMRNKYGDILAVLKGTRLSVYGIGLLLFMAATIAASYRMKLIIEAQDIPVTFMEATSLTFIGYFFNNFLPTSIGGDVVKAYYLSHRRTDKIWSYTAIFVDRIIGLMTMVFMAFVALLFAGQAVDPGVRKIIYAVTASSFVLIVFMANRNFARRFSAVLVLFRPIEEKLVAIYDGINKYRHHGGLMARSLVISVLCQVFFFFSIWFLALSIGARIPIMELVMKMPIISVMSLLPSINGLGLREGSTLVMFGPVIGSESAFAVSVLWLAMLLTFSVMGGVIYAVSPQFKVKLKELE